MTAATSRQLRRVQVRTTAIATVVVAIVLAGGAFGVVRLFEQEQVRRVDSALSTMAQVLEKTDLPDALVLANVPVPADTLIQATDQQGNIIYSSPRLRGLPSMRSVAGDADVTGPVTVEVSGVGAVRSLAVAFRDQWVLFALPLQPVEQSVTTLRTVMLVAVPVLSVALGVLLWVVVGRTLRPVRRAVEREERLVADVSHELRTPLAGVRALLESESQVPAEIELNRLEALAVLGRLESIANGLLAIARQDGRDRRPPAELVDLDEVVLRVVDLTTSPPGIEIDVSLVSGGQVRGNEHDLERMVSNLVVNGLRHARSQVQVTLDEHDDVVRLVVDDDGPGIPVDERERVYERFTRLDDARSRDRGGAGLGLPIARSVAGAHGGTIVTGESPTGGAEFVVTMPSSLTAASARRAPG